jgi:magnesium transporter
VPPESLTASPEAGGFLWVDVEHPSPEDTARLGELFGFHPLALEDVLNDRGLPKQETYGGTLFTVMSALSGKEEPDGTPVTVNVSLFLRERLLVTCHSRSLACMDEVRGMMSDRDLLDHHTPDYLYYLVLDGIIDEYLTRAEKLETKIDDIEEEVFQPRFRRNSDPRRVIYETRRQLSRLGRLMLSKEETLRALVLRDYPQIRPETRTHLRDVLDHVLRARDHLTMMRELLTALMESHLSRLSMRLEESMKLLTIIGTIMLPLSFLTGIWGMNFRHMPGLDWPYSFPVLSGFMLALVAFMLALFRRMRLF